MLPTECTNGHGRESKNRPELRFFRLHTYLDGPSFSGLGSLKGLQTLLQLVGVSNEGLDVNTARSNHLQGCRIAGEGENELA